MNIKVKRKTKDTTKGITLIALVITIIIMLILAGVAISMAIDSNGLFSKANEVVNIWNQSIAEEDRLLQNVLEQANEIRGGGSSDDGDDDTLPEGWESSKIASTVTETSEVAGTTKERIVPIPKAYTVSGISTESTIAGGLVIYEIPEGATVDWTNKKITIDEETSNLQETVNQYVWIPVDDINYMVMCKSNSSSSQCNLVLQNDGTLKCETHDSTDLCGRVYSTTSSYTTVGSKYVFTYAMSFTVEERASQTWNTSSYHEPDIVSDYDNDSNTSYLTAAGVSSANELLTQLTSDFTAMATSVAKYGGFYVSRYEAGANGASKKNQQVLVAGTTTEPGSYSSTYINGNMWYGLYNTLKGDASKNNTGVDTNVVNTHMIWGSQYDQIINFLGTNSTNEPQIAHTNRQLATQELTGSNEADLMNNIYDLEGNNCEWTAQAYSTYGRALRGSLFYGVASGSSTFYPASRRGSRYSSSTYCYHASRCALYIR